MPLAAVEKRSAAAIPSWKALTLLAALTVAGLAPFLNKAYCIDDPLFLWSAQQIQAHPLDFYGCQVNWYGESSPLYDVAKNPPLVCYCLALVGTLCGWNEIPVHAAFLLPAVGVICGTWLLARSFCRQPALAAAVALATPAFLVSSTNVMCDTTMLCFWTWAVLLWIKGQNPPNGYGAAVASILVIAASLTKYFAISLIPLLAVDTVLRQRRPTRQLFWLFIPIAALAGYQWWTSRLYGRGLLSDAAVYVNDIASAPESIFAQETVASKTLTALAFLGASFLPVLFLALWLWPKPGLAVAAILAQIVAFLAMTIPSPRFLAAFHMDRQMTGLQAVQFGLFAACGVFTLWLAASDVARRRTADACLLALWVFGTFLFAGFINWTCNVRSMLPMAPAVGILVMRQIGERQARQSIGPTGWRLALAASVAVALMVAWADFCFANSGRRAAREIAATLAPHGRTVWFQGHWGFQYYLRATGAREISLKHPQSVAGDFLVIPRNNTNTVTPSARFAARVERVDVPACRWLATVEGTSGIGFYSATWGPLPFAFGPAPDERYTIWRIKSDAGPIGK